MLSECRVKIFTTLFLSFYLIADPIYYVTFIVIFVFKIKTEESSDDSDVIIESEFIKPLKQGTVTAKHLMVCSFLVVSFLLLLF